MNDTSSQPANVAAVTRAGRNEWPIFISYRRSDAMRRIALELKKELEDFAIETATGQTVYLKAFVDVAEGHQPDFQAHLRPRLQHSRALIVLADENAARRKVDATVDFLYQELDWWAAKRKKDTANHFTTRFILRLTSCEGPTICGMERCRFYGLLLGELEK